MKLIPDYLGREQCDSVKGIFILWVFLSHFMGYVSKVGGYVVPVYIGQMMVTLFLFYSGYGVMESIKKKGDDYVRAMPKRRILTTLLNFDVAVLVFVALNLLLGNPMTLKQIALSLVCWDSVGNSNWYIFAIICCYFSAYVSCRSVRFRHIGGLICLMLLMVYVVGMSFIKGCWWYDTVLCFPIGMIYSQYRSHIEAVIQKRYALILVFVFFVYSILSANQGICIKGLLSNVRAISFVAIVLLIISKFRIRNIFLTWCGKNLFPLYIYQRVPMLALFTLDPTGFATWRMPLYFMISLVVTFVIARFYHFWEVKLSV